MRPALVVQVSCSSVAEPLIKLPSVEAFCVTPVLLTPAEVEAGVPPTCTTRVTRVPVSAEPLHPSVEAVLGSSG